MYTQYANHTCTVLKTTTSKLKQIVMNEKNNTKARHKQFSLIRSVNGGVSE